MSRKTLCLLLPWFVSSRTNSVILLFLASLISLPTLAQHNLSGSRQKSAWTYIYRLTPKEALLLHRSNMDELDEKHLHTKVDSFATDKSEAPELKPGNYLFVQAVNNELEDELKTIDDLQIKLLSNDRDLLIALHDKNGKTIKDAQIEAGRKKMVYDDRLQVFRLNKERKPRTIKVYHQGTLHYYTLGKTGRGFWFKLAWYSPLRYVIQPVRRLINPRRFRRYQSYFGSGTTYEKKFTGFMVFSKPKYKIGDTVKLKAWVATRKGKPINRPLLLRLTDYRFEKDTILTTLKPYRPGGYEYSFVITDSLDLTLDLDHGITLEELSSRKYNLHEYDGDLEEREYALKRSVVMRGKFYHEEYELGSVTFKARSDKNEHNRGNLVAVYCKATDENEMAVMDGRVQLLIKPVRYGEKEFYGSQVFLPDTLWNHEQPLESVGETKIVIPDSVFPMASFKYEITCIFLNSNNEEKTVTLQQSFSAERRQVKFDQQEDSVHISLWEAGKSIPASATLLTYAGSGKVIKEEPVQLPTTIRLDPFAEFYEIENDSLYEDFHPGKTESVISCRSLRTRDSVMIQVVNPRRLSFWYTIFAGNKVISRGYSDSLLFAERVRTPKNYFISLQYIYANTAKQENYTIPFKEKALNIQVDQPGQVYPGQQVKVDIAVTDADGKPVPGADVTAYAFTKKFSNAATPRVPYLGKAYRSRKTYNQFYHQESTLNDGSFTMNWERWSKEMGLDSIEYYRFLHPDTIYTNTENANHNITQIAPFVVFRGNLQPVHLLYIDEEPYFFSQAQQLQQYSFAVKPGKHALRIRTPNRLIYVDSIWATEGMKTFLSINADTSNKAIRQRKMPDTLTNQEKALWSKYMILMENTFGEKLASVEQNNRITIVNLAGRLQTDGGYYADRYSIQNILTGPLAPITTTLQVKERFVQPFQPEGSYLFNIAPGLIKQKQLPYGRYPFNSRLFWDSRKPAFKDFALTTAAVDSLWQDFLDHRNATEDLFRNTELNATDNGRLQIGRPLDEQRKDVFVRSVILFRYDDPDFARIYKGNTQDMGYVQPGMYRLMLLLRGDQYYIKDSLLIKAYGINYYAPGIITPRPQDSTSIRIAAIINNRESNWRSYHQTEDLDNIKTTFHNQYLDLSQYSKTISGHIVDGRGDPIPGVMVSVKGTSVTTVTNIAGYFELRVPEKGTIVVSAVGYVSVTKKITEAGTYDIRMAEAENALQEVIVVGYGTERGRSITASVTSVSVNQLGLLQGRAPGIMIRGSSFEQDYKAKPLVLVDGQPIMGDWNNMDKGLIAGVDILNDATGQAIYGSRAAGGVILITTKKGQLEKELAREEEAIQPGNTLRTKFRDDAFWQPSLRTDKHGKASFTTTWPDDITNWRTVVIAMSNNRQTGIAESAVRSFKALTGAIALPQFAVVGDSIQVIGKTMNYGLDTINVKRTFSINGTVKQEATISVTNARIDSFMVAIVQQDSAKFKYTIQKDDGYFDGEERSIPVFKQGVQETKGFFATLENDTTITLQPDAALGKMIIHAETSVLPVLLDEIETLRNYEYLCNEQVASKLKALLLKKKVYGYLKKDFKEEKNIRELLARLNQSKSEGLMWGWWSNNTPVLWITQHVAEALLMAEQQGYTVNLNKQALIDYLVLNFNQYQLTEKITTVRLLQLLSAKTDYKKYIDTLDKYVKKETLYEKLQVLQLKQAAGLPVLLDTFITKQQRTMMGNLYWGEEEDRYHFFNNTIQNTLAMYHLLKHAGNQEQLLKKIRYYFLEKRKDGKWRNTFESALILETIMPDLLNNETALQPASLTITGTQANVVNTFPYTTTVSGTDKMTITKQKGMPVYFTAYQQNWNPAPKKVEGDFIVQSFFEHNDQTKATLKAGEPVTLKVEVTVKADAGYVMVEIPIPAGCSYKDKNQSWQNNEVHREYFKNKVSIFSSSLQKGKYTFTVSLLPRYTGSYHLNPAKAEMMYFPVFYGREEMKKISIR
ncbi:MAG: carboxypeptidase-like regulatory domain-containing protein [Niastella sp.]|nr:carboxypeptidase-like regulatory domain-containing protein [Niastella sp.]